MFENKKEDCTSPKGILIYWMFKQEIEPSDPVATHSENQAEEKEEKKPAEEEATPSYSVAKQKETPITKPKTYMGIKGIHIDADIKVNEEPNKAAEEEAEEEKEAEVEEAAADEAEEEEAEEEEDN